MATKLTQAQIFRAMQNARGNYPTTAAARAAANAAYARAVETGAGGEALDAVRDALRRGLSATQIRASLNAGGLNRRGAMTAGGTSGREFRRAFRAAGVDPGETQPM